MNPSRHVVVPNGEAWCVLLHAVAPVHIAGAVWDVQVVPVLGRVGGVAAVADTSLCHNLCQKEIGGVGYNAMHIAWLVVGTSLSCANHTRASSTPSLNVEPDTLWFSTHHWC